MKMKMKKQVIGDSLVMALTLPLVGCSSVGDFFEEKEAESDFNQEERQAIRAAETRPEDPIITTQDQEKYAFLRLETSPRGVYYSVYIDEKPVYSGEEPLKLFTIASNTNYRVEVKADGFKSCEIRLRLGAQERKKTTCQLMTIKGRR